MPPFLNMNSTRHAALLACCLAPLCFGAFAAFVLQQDANWDLRNYHWYNPYAFLNGRWDVDIMPAQTPTFYNPTLDVPFFVMAQWLSARAVGFVMGTIQGLNFVFLYVIGAQLLAAIAVNPRRLAAVALTLVGVLGGGNLGLLGTTFYDNIVSLFVLGSIATVMGLLPTLAMEQQATSIWPRLIFAGFLVGAGTGLKLPTAVFAIGLCAGLLFTAPHIVQCLSRSFAFGVGVLTGIGAFAGHWMWFLWVNYRNPLFPYFNAFFDSPMGVAESYRDARFIPSDLLEWLFFPIVTALNPMQAGEAAFRDWRIAAALIALLFTLGFAVMTHKRAPQINTVVVRNRALYLITAAALSYVAWLGLFGIYRYAITLEMLAPLVIVAAVSLWPMWIKARIAFLTTTLVAVTLSTVPGDWGRVPWAIRFVETTAPTLPRPDQTMVLMLGTTPTSWVIPAFPKSASFVRVQGYGIGLEDGETGLNQKVRARIAAHRGDFFTLASVDDRALAGSLLANFGLAQGDLNCRKVISNLAEGAELCAVIAKEQRP